MPSYQLPSSRYCAVANGNQTFALQLPRKATSPRHVRVGETMRIRVGGETKTFECVARAVIHMDKAGIRRLLDPSYPAIADRFDAGQVIFQRFLNAENASATAEASRDAIARTLGHDDYDALWRAEFAREDGRGKVSRGVIARELVGWIPAEEEA
ncbi:hypothetical protein [Brevundimonas sp.]|uniref:hypothetical protein n=1 Tax=Brevundimonas sp. TaxID=1871086 RepID=UPI002608DB6D|nr:hypothetical protein [Brevundimonas sp.]